MSESQADFPPLPDRGGTLDRALELVEFLRARCPWDAAQTPHSLRRHLLEEAHEVVDAIDEEDVAGLQDELGDLLLNLAFQIVIAEEQDSFGREAVVAGLEAKMRRRHPHLYGDGEAQSWDEAKARERGTPFTDEDEGRGILDRVLPASDSLREAQRIQERVARVGFDWPEPRGAWEKVQEEIDEVGEELGTPGSAALEDEIGDLLFSVVNLARLSGVDAPTALARANRKFRRRFGEVERRALAQGLKVEDAGLDRLEALWDEAKREER